jgi:hypothetical protein
MHAPQCLFRFSPRKNTPAFTEALSGARLPKATPRQKPIQTAGRREGLRIGRGAQFILRSDDCKGRIFPNYGEGALLLEGAGVIPKSPLARGNFRRIFTAAEMAG